MISLRYKGINPHFLLCESTPQQGSGYRALVHINIIANEKGMAQFFSIDVWPLLNKTFKILVCLSSVELMQFESQQPTFISKEVKVLGLPGSKHCLTTEPVVNHKFRMRYTVLKPNLVAWLTVLGLMPCSSMVITSFFCSLGIYRRLDMAVYR
jgi:hypothetical protein